MYLFGNKRIEYIHQTLIPYQCAFELIHPLQFSLTFRMILSALGCCHWFWKVLDVREIWLCRLHGLNFGDCCFDSLQLWNAFGKGCSLPHGSLKRDTVRNVSHREESVLALYMIVFVSFSVKAVARNWVCLHCNLPVTGDLTSFIVNFDSPKTRPALAKPSRQRMIWPAPRCLWAIWASRSSWAAFSLGQVVLKLKVQHSLSIPHLTYLFPQLPKLVPSWGLARAAWGGKMYSWVCCHLLSVHCIQWSVILLFTAWPQAWLGAKI